MSHALTVGTKSLTAAIRADAERLIEQNDPRKMVGELNDALRGSLAESWDPDINRMAATLTEINPADYAAGKRKGDARRVDRSGWVTMPDRIIGDANVRLSADVAAIESALEKTHPGGDGDPIRWIIWAGMGGSAEIVRLIAGSKQVQATATRRRSIFVLDSTDREALGGVLAQISEGRPEALGFALVKTIVIGVSLGMTSEEPVINMTALDAIFEASGMSVQDRGAHFWGMTLEGSTVHEFLKVKGWGDHRVPLQLDGDKRSTLSGRNSYVSRVGLLPLTLLGIDATSHLASQAAPHFTDGDREEAFRAAAAIVAAERAGLTQPTLLLPEGFEAAAFWLMQETEESLGKNRDHLIKIDAPQTESDMAADRPGGQPRRLFIDVRMEGEDGAQSKWAALRRRLGDTGAPVLAITLSKTGGALGAVPTLLHFWTHVIAGIGYAWQADTVGQYYVEGYKKYVQISILEAMKQGGFGDYSFDVVNTPEVTVAKQRWLLRPDRERGSIKTTKQWRDLFGSAETATFDRVTLYFEAALGRGHVKALAGSDASDVYAAWLTTAAKDGGVSFAELTFFGDMNYTTAGHALLTQWDRFKRDLFDGIKLLGHVVEGPRDNHSRLEMSMAGRNEGIITLATGSFAELDRPATDVAPHLRTYPADYLALQALATYWAYRDEGRRIVVLSGEITPEWVERFCAEVRKKLGRASLALQGASR
jgi:glucose-6-phosphate isomerase